jgi:hypothetical protein
MTDERLKFLLAILICAAIIALVIIVAYRHAPKPPVMGSLTMTATF